MYRTVLIGWISVFSVFSLSAQTASVTSYQVDKGRLLWHDKVDKQQKLLLKLDGKDDNQLYFSADETVNLQLEYALVKMVDEVQERIELDSLLTHSGKVKYLLGLEDMLKLFITHHRKKRSKAATHSILDDVPGIGEARRNALLEHFGGLQKLRTAGVEELAAVPGMTRPLAEKLQEYLQVLLKVE